MSVINKSINYLNKLFYIFYTKFNGIEFYKPTSVLLNNQESFSQLSQDIIALKFLQKNKKINSIIKIVDIGSNDPILYNNTLMFENNFNTEIFSIDANSKFVEIYSQKRKCRFISSAIGSERKIINLYIPDGTNPDHNNDMFATVSMIDLPEELRGKVNSIQIETKPLIDLIPKGDYDILFIDVEGAEYEVLNGIDFNSFNFKLIVIENNRGFVIERKIRKYIISKGYSWIARIDGLDDFYFKN